ALEDLRAPGPRLLKEGLEAALRQDDRGAVRPVAHPQKPLELPVDSRLPVVLLRRRVAQAAQAVRRGSAGGAVACPVDLPDLVPGLELQLDAHALDAVRYQLADGALVPRRRVVQSVGERL